MKVDFYINEYGEELTQAEWLYTYVVNYYDYQFSAWLFDLEGIKVVVCAQTVDDACKIIYAWTENSHRLYLIGITDEYLQEWEKAKIRGDLGPDLDPLYPEKLSKPKIILEK